MGIEALIKLKSRLYGVDNNPRHPIYWFLTLDVNKLTQRGTPRKKYLRGKGV
jgi:hypothetical protein